jgi:hypothetical protein
MHDLNHLTYPSLWTSSIYPVALWAPQTETEHRWLGFWFYAPNTSCHSFLPLPPPTIINSTHPSPHQSSYVHHKSIAPSTDIEHTKLDIWFWGLILPLHHMISPCLPPAVIMTTHPSLHWFPPCTPCKNCTPALILSPWGSIFTFWG